MIMVQQFFGSGSYSIIGPYMAEIWPSRLRASGLGLAYGAGRQRLYRGPMEAIASDSRLSESTFGKSSVLPAPE
jgi:hypothetical protein